MEHETGREPTEPTDATQDDRFCAWLRKMKIRSANLAMREHFNEWDSLSSPRPGPAPGRGNTRRMEMEENLRPVVAEVLVEHRKPRVEKPGVFHCWGSDYEEFDVGGVTFTVAVIEFPDGTVGMIRADLVRFTDTTPETPE